MGIYAAFGVAQAVSMFLIGSSFAVLTYFASQRLHKVGGRVFLSPGGLIFLISLVQDAIERVMHAPMSFFETTVNNIYSTTGSFSERC